MPTEDGLLRELEDRQDSSSLKRIQAYFGYLNSTEKDFFTLQGNRDTAQNAFLCVFVQCIKCKSTHHASVLWLLNIALNIAIASKNQLLTLHVKCILHSHSLFNLPVYQHQKSVTCTSVKYSLMGQTLFSCKGCSQKQRGKGVW